MEANDNKVFSLLQPDLLTVDELLGILKQRCPKLPDMDLLEKDNLVGVFNKLVLPLPQRRYATNRRGNFLTQKRIKSKLETKGTSLFECLPTESSNKPKSSLGKRVNIERLKPPPDCDRPTKIKILSSQARDAGLEKIVVNDRRKKSVEEKDYAEKTQLKRSCEDHEHTDRAKSLVLKRSSGDDVKEATKSTNDSPPKKQRIAIKWP